MLKENSNNKYETISLKFSATRNLTQEESRYLFYNILYVQYGKTI